MKILLLDRLPEAPAQLPKVHFSTFFPRRLAAITGIIFYCDVKKFKCIQDAMSLVVTCASTAAADRI